MVQFGTRQVGDGQPCFITYEAGPTHSGLESAKRLVSLAAEASADAIKFQVIDPDRLVADRKQLFTYDILLDRETGETETVSEPLYDILCRRALTKDEWRALKRHSDGLGLAFFATIGFEDEIELLEELNCDSIKIASADVNHTPLLRRAARSGMCLQLDTGNATIGEIEAAIDVIRAEGNENIIIHHCPSGYPARLESINLNVIPTLKRMFPYPVAYSDHTPGWDMDLAAVALGANLVEKTISEDRTTRSVEHIMSIEPAEMARFITVIRDLETALGSPRRIMNPAEIGRRNAIRRSIHLRQDCAAGSVLSLADLEFRRPGTGIPPSETDRLIGKTLRVAKSAGERLGWSDLEL
ncbi:MAG: N-acetylneuraminate synthase family protein [Kiloniellaceae bacterium]